MQSNTDIHAHPLYSYAEYALKVVRTRFPTVIPNSVKKPNLLLNLTKLDLTIQEKQIYLPLNEYFLRLFQATISSN